MKAIIYISEPKVAFNNDTLIRLNESSSEHNARMGISGFLCYHNNTFIQYFEGDAVVVDALMTKLELDERHTICFKLSQPQLEQRRFPDWHMKLIPSEFLEQTSIEAFLHKQLKMMDDTGLDSEHWCNLIWQGVELLAQHQAKAK